MKHILTVIITNGMIELIEGVPYNMTSAPLRIHQKFELYQKHKIKEYWVIYPNEKFIDRFVLGEEGKYVTPIAFAEKDKMTTSILEGLEITIEKVFK